MAKKGHINVNLVKFNISFMRELAFLVRPMAGTPIAFLLGSWFSLAFASFFFTKTLHGSLFGRGGGTELHFASAFGAQRENARGKR